MAGVNNNLIPMNERTKSEQTKIATMGGIASGKARNYKKEQIENLKKLLDETSKSGKTYRELMNLGIIKGALNGKAENFKAIMDYLEDNSTASGTPTININIIDNSNLEGSMYEADKLE